MLSADGADLAGPPEGGLRWPSPAPLVRPELRPLLPQHTPLGAPGLYIQTLLPGSPAAADGRLSLGDRILEVNGSSLTGVSYLRYPRPAHRGREPRPGPPAARVRSSPRFRARGGAAPPALLSPDWPATGRQGRAPGGVGWAAQAAGQALAPAHWAPRRLAPSPELGCHPPLQGRGPDPPRREEDAVPGGQVRRGHGPEGPLPLAPSLGRCGAECAIYMAGPAGRHRALCLES